MTGWAGRSGRPLARTSNRGMPSPCHKHGARLRADTHGTDNFIVGGRGTDRPAEPASRKADL